MKTATQQKQTLTFQADRKKTSNSVMQWIGEIHAISSESQALNEG